jgi:hypothetical protein
MSSLLRRRLVPPKLTYANVVASLALFVALAGTGYAAVKLPKNSVGTTQIKSAAVTATKIKDGAVTGAKLAPAGVTGADIAPGSIQGADIDLPTLGTVPSAAEAGHARIADRATAADSATVADDARTLAGKSAAQLLAEAKDVCPAQMLLVAGVCFEEAARTPTSMPQALHVCAKEGRFLPSVSMLLTFETNAYEGQPPPEWAGQSYYIPGTGSGAGSRGPAVAAFKYGYSYSEGEPTGASLGYRCAAMPTN